MMKQFSSLITILFVIFTPGCSQVKKVADSSLPVSSKSNAVFVYQQFIPGYYTHLDVDLLDNIYLVSGNSLKKLNSNGDSIAAFNDVKKYGNPSYIDVSNPLKILVYYQNFSTVVILDRLLTMRNTINFRKQNIFSVRTIGTSYDNNIWLFDEQDFKLKKISEEGIVIQESTDMRLLVDAVPSPNQLIDNDNLVYLYDQKKGFYIFDYYGAFKNNLPFINWKNTAIARNKIYGFSDSQLYSYELKSLILKKYDLPPFFKGHQEIKALNGKVYLLKQDGVEIYTVK